jgi:hypothetical protein
MLRNWSGVTVVTCGRKLTTTVKDVQTTTKVKRVASAQAASPTVHPESIITL